MEKLLFRKALDETLRAELEGLDEDVDKIAHKCAKKCVKDIKADSPLDTGFYRDSWECQRERKTSGSIAYRAFNDGAYQLTHLLENGHEIWAMRDGHITNTGKRTKPRPHINKHADVWIEEFVKECEMLAKRGK